MAVPVELVELQKNGVADGVAVDCAMQAYAVTDIELYYGTSKQLAVYSTDYEVTLNTLTYADFTFTPTASLITKITNLGEGNVTFVVRNTDPTTDFTENDGFVRQKIAFEMDRLYMAVQWLRWKFAGVATSLAALAASVAAAAASAAAAAASAVSAEAAYDAFDDRWLGAKAADPTLDNDGDALLVGATYFNTTFNLFKVWNGAAFDFTYLPAGAYLLLAGGDMTGPLITFASAAGGAGLRVPHGSAPSAPVDGDMWTTTAALQYRQNGTTKTAMDLESAQTLSGKKTLPTSTTGGASITVPHGVAPSAPVDGDVWTTSALLLIHINGVTKTVVFTTDLPTVVGRETVFIPAGAMYPRTTNGCATLATAESTTNKVMRKSLDFDATTQEFAQVAFQMPKNYDGGNVYMQYVWSHAATATNFGVAFALQGVSLANDDAMDGAFGTEQVAVDTGGTTDDIYISPETAAITIAGAAAEEWVVLQIKRVPADGSDTMAIDARLHGFRLIYVTNAPTDN